LVESSAKILVALSFTVRLPVVNRTSTQIEVVSRVVLKKEVA
jgi:hypothetical protein